MKITINVHDGGDLVENAITSFCTQENPSAVLGRISDGISAFIHDEISIAQLNSSDQAEAQELKNDIDLLVAKWIAREDKWSE